MPTTSTIQINGLTATLNTWQTPHGAQTPLHFAHCNGFPSGSYRQMLSLVAQTRPVFALDHRATWPDAPAPNSRFTWAKAADDLIAGIEQFAPNGVIGVGHSLGGVVTLFAAYRRPDLFQRIVLIEPVMVPIKRALMAAFVPAALKLKHLPLAAQALRRKDVWPSRQAFVDYHASKAAFKNIPLSVMHDYAQYGLRQREDDFILTFPKVWEAHIFSTPPYIWSAISRLKTPCIIAKSGGSHWIAPESWAKLARIRPDIEIHTLPNVGHLAPQQAPEQTAQWLMGLLTSA